MTRILDALRHLYEPDTSGRYGLIWEASSEQSLRWEVVGTNAVSVLSIRVSLSTPFLGVRTRYTVCHRFWHLLRAWRSARGKENTCRGIVNTSLPTCSPGRQCGGAHASGKLQVP